MTHDEFVSLVQRLEQFAARHPASYRRRLALLALLGYAYLLLLVVLFLGIFAGLVYVSIRTHRLSGGELKLLFGLLVVAWIIGRSLFFRVPRPEGIALSRETAPALFAVIADVCAAVDARPPSRVLLVDEYNAFAAQMPRFGLFGGGVTYLALGLPYLQSASPQQFRSVLAHEIGHLSERHGRFSVWIWRIRTTWARAMEQLQGQRHLGVLPLAWFANWYGPRFLAYSFVISRAHEVEADRYSEQVAGRRVAAEELAMGGVYMGFLEEEFWPAVARRVADLAEPPTDVYRELGAALRQPLPPEKADEWLKGALGPTTTVDDTHPALRDRLAALRYPNAFESEAVRRELLAAPPEVTAAEQFLGRRADEYAIELGKRWAAAIAPVWEQQRREAGQSARRLGELAAKAVAGSLSQEEAWERARLTLESAGPAQAEPLLQQMHAVWPDYAPASFALGQCLLERDDARGVALIEGAMAADTLLVRPGCEQLYGYLRRKGRNAEAESYRRRAMAREDLEQAAVAEAVHLTKRDVFLPHGLAQDVVDDLRQRLQGIKRAKEGYLVQRQLRIELGRPCYLLGIVPDFSGHFVDQDQVAREVLEALHATGDPPVELFPVCLYANREFAVEKLRAVDGAQIFQRSGKQRQRSEAGSQSAQG